MISDTGNPTRLPQVVNDIGSKKSCTRKKSRKQKKPSQARTELVDPEWIQVMTAVEDNSDHYE